MCNNMYFVYQIKKILNKAEEIGQKIGKGLTRVRHRSDYLNDSRSLPTEQMPNWWISSGWLPPESSDDDDESEDDLINDNKMIHDRYHHHHHHHPHHPQSPLKNF